MNQRYPFVIVIFLILFVPSRILPVEHPEKYIPLIFNISANDSVKIIIVDKKQQLLYIITSPRPDSINVLDTFRISTGKEKGNKTAEGDHRTPEGIYYVKRTIDDQLLPPRYGPLALVLDYPNILDKLQYHTGSNIWIHGRDEEITGWQTEGCISLQNHHITDLFSHITINKTPVIIVDSLTLLNRKDYLNERKKWIDYLDRWRASWESGDTTTFFSFYSSKYHSSSGDMKEFKANKKRLEKKYKWKKIQIEDIIVYSSDFETHINFLQRYVCPFLISIGRKRIMLSNSDSGRIFSEEFKPSGPVIQISEKARSFLDNWIKSWESRDIQQYSNFYHEEFSTGNFDKKSWIEYKNNLFKDTDFIRVIYSNLNVNSPEKLKWRFSFKQNYTSDNYHDVGIKTITVTGIPEDWKIIKEEWKYFE